LITNTRVYGVGNSKFKCRSYELFHFSCIKFIFLVIFGELLDVAMWLKLPKDMEPMKFFLAKKSWLLYFLNIKIQKITHGSTQCHIWCGCLDLLLKPLILFKKICRYQSVDFLGIDPLSLKHFKLTHTCTSQAKNWAINDQVDLEIISKSCEDSYIASNFHEFWNGGLSCEKQSQNLTLWSLNVIILWIPWKGRL
jgi:hypothetical protein